MKRRMLIFLVAFCGALTMNVDSYGSDLKNEQITSNEKVIASEERSKDQIVTKYRIHNGKKQYRRWNKTKKCWVDSKWIDL